MKLKNNNQIMIIADDSENAIKIKDGYDFEITDKSELKLKKQTDKVKTSWQLKKNVKKIKDIEDIKKVLIDLLEIID